MSVEDVSLKAAAYGMAKDRFFARDVFEVEARVGEAVERARSSNQPTLIEARTYRFRGHSMSDPGKYRTPAEIEEHKKNDTLVQARSALLAGGAGEKLAELETEVEREIEDAVRFAEESPEPTVDLLEPTTYAGPFAR
jgi:pyruvate dehydrogenase E1 component alpha subunit